MKWLIVSDLHGSAVCCEQILERFRLEGAQRLILLGDILYHGPRNPLPQGYDPKAVFSMLNDHASVITAVRGNCDAPVDQWVLKFPIMSEYRLLTLGQRKVFVTHGDKWSAEAPPSLPQGSLLACGHVHLAALEQRHGYYYLNPGSPALPHDGFRGYLTVTEQGAALKTLSGEAIRELSW